MTLQEPRRTLVGSLLLAAALLFGGCGQTDTAATSGDATPNSQPAATSAQRVRAGANQLLDGGVQAFSARLHELHGSPVVVNQWASWCGPCRFEFPFFQHLSQRYARRVAFLGVDSQDARDDARDFLKRFPVPYPQYFDQNASIARTFGGGRAWPTTAFFDVEGKLVFTHLGAYATEAKLDADILNYALHG